MFRLQASTPRWVIVLMDLVISFIALIFAYLIRFDLKADPELIRQEWQVLSKSIGIYFLVKLIVFLAFKIQKGIVRHTSTEDLKRILLATATCSLIFFGLGLLRYYFVDEYFLFPTSVLIIEFLMGLLLMIGSRFFIKLLYLESIKSNQDFERVIIYGAGISGLITKRTIEKDGRLNYKIVAFIDDNKKKDGTRMEGVTVCHTSKLEALIQDEGVNNLIIAIQQPNEENRQRVVEICLANGIKVSKVPTPKSWINGEFSTKQISRVNIEDLLGRSPIVLDENRISNQLTGQIILVSGAAGSIGSGLVKQIARYNPGKLILLDQAESPLYDLQIELGATHRELNFEVVIGDIRSVERMERVFDFFQPNFVFHAAAYKHVPMMENNPSEAVLTNVLGTKNLVDLSQRYEVKKFVMISTDKAVNPTNVMGASKRIAEIYAQMANKAGNTLFVTTRFGNVLGSNGSDRKSTRLNSSHP